MTLQEIAKYALRGRRYRIAHRMPGRLRLILPDLVLVPDEFENHIATARALLEKLPGMQSVLVNRMTQSILFQYDTSTVSETELLGWFERLQQKGLKRFGELNAGTDIHARLSSVQLHLNTEIERIRTQHAAAMAKN